MPFLPPDDDTDMLPKNQGAFLSVLNYLGRFGQVGKNVLTGNLEGALRQGADIVGDSIDSVLPGDWIPEISRPQDYKTGADVLRIDKGWQEKHPVLGFLASLPVDIATDPLTYTGLGPLAKVVGGAGTIAAKGISKVPGGAEALAKGSEVGHFTRKMFSAEKPTAEIASAERAARAKGGVTRQAAQTAGVEGFAGVDPETQRRAVEIINGVTSEMPSMDKSSSLVVGAGRPSRLKGETTLDIDPTTSPSIQADIRTWVPDKQYKSVYAEAVPRKALTPAAIKNMADATSEGGHLKIATGEALGEDTASGIIKQLDELGFKDAFYERRADGGWSIEGLKSPGVEAPASVQGGGYRSLGITPSSKFVTKAQQMDLIDRRLAGMPWDDVAKQAVRAQTDKITDFTRGAFSQGVGDSVFGLPDDINATSSLATKQLEQAPADYFPRMFGLEEQMGLTSDLARPASPAMLNARSLTDSDKLAEHLTATGAKLDTNVPKVLGEYGENMGRAVQSASMGKALAGDSYRALTDEPSRKAVQDIADNLRASGDLDSAHVIETVIKGVPTPGAFTSFLAKANKPFKAAATGGILVPRLNFTVGNVTSSVWQAFSNKESRAQTWNTAKRVIPTIFRSVSDGLKQLGIHVMSDSEAEVVAKAARESGGTRAGMLERITDPDLRGAVEQGVLDGGFVNSEQMMADAAERLKGAKSLKNWLYWPQVIAKSSEQQLRFGLFKDLKKAKLPDAEAARITNEALLNYNMTSAENRSARGVIPFFQFTAKTVPQQAKFLSEHSLAGSAARNALRGGLTGQDDPVYPWMEGKANIPIGQDEAGNNQYLSSLRLPFEVLGQIPNPSDSLMNFGREAEQSIGGSAHPLLKTAYSVFSGEDPYFDSPFGTYSKLPGNVEAGAVGRAYNQLAGTGLIQPLASIGQTIGKFADDRTSPAEKAINILTGAKIQSVDADLALQQKLTEYLKRHPDVKSFESLYTKSDDPQVQALLKELQAAKARLKAKRSSGG